MESQLPDVFSALSQVPGAQGRAWYITTSPVLRPSRFFSGSLKGFPACHPWWEELENDVGHRSTCSTRRWLVAHFLIGKHVECLHLENVTTSPSSRFLLFCGTELAKTKDMAPGRDSE